MTTNTWSNDHALAVNNFVLVKCQFSMFQTWVNFNRMFTRPNSKTFKKQNVNASFGVPDQISGLAASLRSCAKTKQQHEFLCNTLLKYVFWEGQRGENPCNSMSFFASPYWNLFSERDGGGEQNQSVLIVLWIFTPPRLRLYACHPVGEYTGNFERDTSRWKVSLIHSCHECCATY